MNYYDWMEEENIKNLYKLNGDKHWFAAITPTERFNHTDAVCWTKNGRKITVELKTRDESIEQFQHWGDVLIEPQKLAHFSLIQESGYTLGENCLYINFCKDGTIIFSFNDLKSPVKVYVNHKHYNKGKKRMEHETRFGLSMDDAMIIRS